MFVTCVISPDVGATTDASSHYPGSQTTSSSATFSDDVSDSTSTMMSDVPKREIPYRSSSRVGEDDGSSPDMEKTQPLSSTPQEEDHSPARSPRSSLGLGNLQPCECTVTPKSVHIVSLQYGSTLSYLADCIT